MGNNSKKKKASGKKSDLLANAPISSSRLELEELFAPLDFATSPLCDASPSCSRLVESRSSGDRAPLQKLDAPSRTDRKARDEPYDDAEMQSVDHGNPATDPSELGSGTDQGKKKVDGACSSARDGARPEEARSTPLDLDGFTTVQRNKGKNKLLNADDVDSPHLPSSAGGLASNQHPNMPKPPMDKSCAPPARDNSQQKSQVDSKKKVQFADTDMDADFPPLPSSSAWASKQGKRWVKKGNSDSSNHHVRQNTNKTAGSSNGGKPLGKDPKRSKPPWNEFFANNRSLENGMKVPFVHDEGCVEDDIAILDSDVLPNDESGISRCLVGYFAGKPVGYKVLMNFIDTYWKVRVEVVYHKSGWIFFRFDDEVTKSNILMKGPFLVLNEPLLLKEMPPFFCYDKEERSRVPVWVKLFNLPLECRTAAIYGKITSRIGKPTSTDKITAGRQLTSFARVLVEVDLALPLVHHVWVALPNGSRTMIEIEYERIPLYCSLCKVLGHSRDRCGLAQMEQELQKENKEDASHSKPPNGSSATTEGCGSGANPSFHTPPNFFSNPDHPHHSAATPPNHNPPFAATPVFQTAFQPPPLAEQFFESPYPAAASSVPNPFSATTLSDATTGLHTDSASHLVFCAGGEHSILGASSLELVAASEALTNPFAVACLPKKAKKSAIKAAPSAVPFEEVPQVMTGKKRKQS